MDSFKEKRIRPNLLLPQPFLFLLLLSAILLSGCAKNKDLERKTQEQAATIQSLNNEIARLNRELEQAIHSKEDLTKAKTELEKRLKGELEAGDMSISLQDRGLVVTVLDRVLFDSGKAELKSSSKASLDKLSRVLEEKVGDHMIYVEGHTDNEPIRYSDWQSNWELSTSRATGVIHYFVEDKGFVPERLAAIGYGQYHPVVSNDTPEGRMKNRRVEIVISPKKISGIATNPAAT